MGKIKGWKKYAETKSGVEYSSRYAMLQVMSPKLAKDVNKTIISNESGAIKEPRKAMNGWFITYGAFSRYGVGVQTSYYVLKDGFSSKEEARVYAIKFMRSHPNG